MYEALAYRRFNWPDAPDDVGDVERILTYTGYSIPLRDDEGNMYVRPIAPVSDEQIYGPITVTPIGTDRTVEVWPNEIIRVAPAREILKILNTTLWRLDQTQINNAYTAGVTRAVRTRDENKGDAAEFANGFLTRPIPIIKTSAALSPDDIITVGDGQTHAAEVNDLTQVALSRAAQALGVHMDVVIKRERVVSDEIGATRDIVDVVREHEINERLRLASILGWELEVKI